MSREVTDPAVEAERGDQHCLGTGRQGAVPVWNSAKLMATVPPRAVMTAGGGVFARCKLARHDLVEGVAEGGAEGVRRRCRHRAAGTRDQQDTGETCQRRQPGAPGDAFAKHRGWPAARREVA